MATAQTWNARATAKDVNDALRKAGVQRTLDAKRVRQWVRENIEAYDDDGYTAHVYNAQLHRTIVDGIVKRYTASGTTTKARTSADQRGSAASSGRTPRKPASKPAVRRLKTLDEAMDGIVVTIDPVTPNTAQ